MCIALYCKWPSQACYFTIPLALAPQHFWRLGIYSVLAQWRSLCGLYLSHFYLRCQTISCWLGEQEANNTVLCRIIHHHFPALLQKGPLHCFCIKMVLRRRNILLRYVIILQISIISSCCLHCKLQLIRNLVRAQLWGWLFCEKSPPITALQERKGRERGD